MNKKNQQITIRSLLISIFAFTPRLFSWPAVSWVPYQ